MVESRQGNRPMSLVSTLLGNCLCDPLELAETRGWSTATMFVEIHGIRFIGLGAMMDELTSRQRVYDTLEQLTTRSERMISIGYLVEGEVAESADTSEAPNGALEPRKKAAEAVPLDVWMKNYPSDKDMSPEVNQSVELIKSGKYSQAIQSFRNQLTSQRMFPTKDNNLFLSGITAHNLAVALLLNGNEDKAISMFRDAIAQKQLAFGPDHVELALSWDEFGIQLFAKGELEEALNAFRESHKIRNRHPEYTQHPSMAMVLNNMACCNFEMKNHRVALSQLEEARQIQQAVLGSTAQADLDLLHAAIVMGNCGYLNLCLKQYDTASAILEEALLIQQSVLDENHRAIRDTRTNMEFSNAFHS